MRKIIPSLLSGLLLVGFAACSNDEVEEHNVLPEKAAATFRMQFPKEVHINEDVTTYVEDKVVSVQLAGAMTGNYGGMANPTFTILSYQGKKNFLFTANLNDADLPKITSEEAYNTAILNTADYMRGYQSVPVNKPLLMAGSLRSVYFNEGVLSQDLVHLRRVFASVDYDFSKIAVPGTTINSIVLKNIPAKFRLAGALVDYDLLNAQQPSDYPYIHWTLTAIPKGRIYIPEHVVSKPVFNDPDVNGMTYFEISYTRAAETHVVKYRLAESRTSNKNYGRIMRNTRYAITSNEITPKTEWGN